MPRETNDGCEEAGEASMMEPGKRRVALMHSAFCIYVNMYGHEDSWCYWFWSVL